MLALRGDGGALLGAATLAVLLQAGCAAPVPSREVAILTGGDPGRGAGLLVRHGCIACHTVEAVPQARGQVGPSLDGVGRRPFIAGRLENTPEHLIRWVQDARGLVPETAMPSLGVPEQDARDIAAFLYQQP